jgi:hypothetical protein
MARIPTGRVNTAKSVNITINDFAGGSNNLIDEARMPSKFAVQSNNLMQVQNGLWKTRWGTQNYGVDYGYNPNGASEFIKVDGTSELITIANGIAYKSTDGGALTALTGASFTAGVQCYFMQMGGYDTSNTYHNYLYIANGTDPLTRYDGTSLTQYASLSAPAGLSASLVASGLSSGVYTYYGQVTALNQVGETVGSTEASITTNKLRDDWDIAVDKGVTWSWSTVAGATQYQLYISDTKGYEALLTSLTALSFTDNGSLVINPYVQVPYGNTTTAPLFKSMCTSNNRIWATNDSTDMYKVYFSGTGRQIGAFSDFFGGGWINLERGGKEIPISVKHYQTGTGMGRATVLCKTSNGQGSVWQIDIISATVGSATFSIPSASKVVGSFGAESLSGVVQSTNNLCYPNRKGWFSLGSQANYYGILRTNELSSNIRPYWRSFVGSKIAGICSYFYDAKIFISVPTGSSGNDRMIVFNEELGNWAVDWSIGAKQFFEYTDSTGVTHLLYIPTSGTKLVELSQSYLNDSGVAFNQSYVSPLLPVSADKTDILSHIASIVELGRPQGVINFQVLGIGKDSNFATIATKTITNFGSNTGIGSDLVGDFFATSTNDNTKKITSVWTVYFTATPKTFTQSITKKAIRRKTKLYAIQYKVYSTAADTSWTLNTIQTKGRIIPRRIPSNWISG